MSIINLNTLNDLGLNIIIDTVSSLYVKGSDKISNITSSVFNEYLPYYWKGFIDMTSLEGFEFSLSESTKISLGIGLAGAIIGITSFILLSRHFSHNSPLVFAKAKPTHLASTASEQQRLDRLAKQALLDSNISVGLSYIITQAGKDWDNISPFFFQNVLHLTLEFDSFPTRDGYLRTLENLPSIPQLRTLELRSVAKDSDLSILNKTPNLKQFKLAFCTLKRLHSIPRSLDLLTIQWNNHLTELYVPPETKELVVYKCDSLINIKNLSDSPSLQTVEVEWCDNLRSIPPVCPNYESVTIIKCDSLKIDGIPEEIRDDVEGWHSYESQKGTWGNTLTIKPSLFVKPAAAEG